MRTLIDQCKRTVNEGEEGDEVRQELALTVYGDPMVEVASNQMTASRTPHVLEENWAASCISQMSGIGYQMRCAVCALDVSAVGFTHGR